MDFNVPKGGSSVREIQLEPVAPGQGPAAKWKMTDVSSNPPKEVDSLDMIFSSTSSPAQRQIERMMLAFTIAPSSNAGGNNWRFFGDGILYCDNQEDYLERITPSISNNGKTLTLTVKCLSDIAESFHFSFLAICQDKKSGECKLYASEDPGGSTGRSGP